MTTRSEKRVSPLELFFDLVFVFALTQVTALMSDDPTWEGLGHGLLVLAALWWSWSAYAWLTNEIDADEDLPRLAMFTSMTAMLVAALAVPNAFGGDGVIFGCAYFVVRVMHIVLFAQATPHLEVHDAIIRLGRTAIPASGLLIAAGFLDGPAQATLWVVALGIDYVGPLILGVSGFHVSASHFVERFALIVIIALGESIVAIGVGAAGLELDIGLLAAAALGVIISCALWWAYFDWMAIHAEQVFRDTRGDERARMARDAFSYLHLPMVAGVILVALGIKKTLADVDEPLETVPTVALLGGIGLYLIGHVAFRLRLHSGLGRGRLTAAIVSLALIPLAVQVDDALGALAIAATVSALLILYEVIRFAEPRARLRAGTE
ncbi:MAG: low temperature requirement protein A [Acidimicrobiales bacterium]